MSAFDEALQDTLQIEGGYSDHRADTGGRTKYGITEAVARRYGYNGAMDELPLEFAKKVYRDGYWDRLLLGRVAEIASEAVAAELFDTAVNMGTGAAGKFLQRALNALNDRGRLYSDIPVDGQIGPVTLKALEAFCHIRGQEGAAVLRRALDGLQCAKYIELAENRAENEAFVYGWIKQRIT